MEPSSTLRILYASYRALDAHHAGYMVHGGLPVSGVELSYVAENDIVVVTLQAPDEQQFVVSTRVARISDHRQMLLAFAPEDQPALTNLHQYIAHQDFDTAAAAEPPDLQPAVSFQWTDTTSTTAAAQPSPRGSTPTMGRSAAAPPKTTTGEESTSFLQADIRCPTVLSFLPLLYQLEKDALLYLSPLSLPLSAADTIKLKWILPGYHVIELWAHIAQSSSERLILSLDTEDESYGRLCMYSRSQPARTRRERERQRGQGMESYTVSYHWESVPSAPEHMPLSRRIQRMSTEQKINLALSGQRHERMALARDSNRHIHHYVLKNARITLEEIIYMARLPYINPDVLQKIADDRKLTQHTAVIRALVGNPRTPVPTALRLVGRLSRADLMQLGQRTGMSIKLRNAIQAKLKKYQS